MSTTFKLCLFTFTVPLILFSCSAPQKDMEVTPERSASLSTLAPIPLTANSTASPNSIPQQNDLIFVEFFAGT